MATLTCPMPGDINPLSPNGFRLSIQKLPELSFFAQEVNLPDMMLGEPEFGTPFARVPIPGETLTYGALDIRFLVDSKMENYKAIYNWMIALGFPESYDQYINFSNEDSRNLISSLAKEYSDGVLQILSNTNADNQTVVFYDMFPTSLSSLQFLSTNQDVSYLVGSATFKFSYYKFL